MSRDRRLGRRRGRRLRRRLVAGMAIAAAAVAVALVARALWTRDAPGAVSADVVAFMSAGADDARFTRALAPRALRFPADEGVHPGYRTEWWYYTGNLAGADGGRFGFQLTFFRSALAPPSSVPQRASAWATAQTWLGHFTVSDVPGGAFHSAERLARGAMGLAGARAEPYRVWLESWSAAGDRGHADPVRLRAADGPVAIDLVVRPAKGPALHGDGGFSKKGPEPGNASYYYSYSRLEATGTITSAHRAHEVQGLAWMDHEWSTSALDPATQVGWDWFSLQLDDGRELMLFQIRERDGGVASESSGSLIGADAAVVSLDRADFQIASRGTWSSPHTGADYPSGWHVTVPEHGLDLVVEPLLADQELQTFIRYWEGAVRVTGSAAGRSVAGHGYVELTGYAPVAGGNRGATPGARPPDLPPSAPPT